MGVFAKRNRNSSVDVAKDRLKHVLVSDRSNCTPDAFDLMEQELFRSVSKYFEVSRDQFQVQISRNEIHIRLTGDHS